MKIGIAFNFSQWAVISLMWFSSITSIESRVANFTPIAAVDGKIYFAEQTAIMKWSAAIAFCTESGMRLATIQSENQRNALRNAVWTILNAYWTAGRDSQTPSQFSWEFDRKTLNPDFAVFGGYNPISTCVAYSTTFNSLWSNYCSKERFPLCELLHGK